MREHAGAASEERGRRRGTGAVKEQVGSEERAGAAGEERGRRRGTGAVKEQVGSEERAGAAGESACDGAERVR